MKDSSKLNAIKAQLKSDVMRPAGETDKDAAWIAFDDWFGNAHATGVKASRW